MEIRSFSLNLDAFKIIIGLFDSMETEFCSVDKNKCIEMISFLALLDVTSIIIGLGDSMIFKSHYMGYYFSEFHNKSIWIIMAPEKGSNMIPTRMMLAIFGFT